MHTFEKSITAFLKEKQKNCMHEKDKPKIIHIRHDK